MTLSRDSLSGQNSQGRLSGARSSRALSTIFKRLRECDRKIGRIDKSLAILRKIAPHQEKSPLNAKRAALDEKRKQFRNQRKGYATP